MYYKSSEEKLAINLIEKAVKCNNEKTKKRLLKKANNIYTKIYEKEKLKEEGLI